MDNGDMEIRENGNIEHSPTLKNSKKDRETQLLHYDFTFPNYPLDLGDLETKLTNICKKWIYGFEICPTTGTPHLQGYMGLKCKMRMVEIHKLIKGFSLRPAKKIKNLIAYCAKDGNFRKYKIKDSECLPIVDDEDEYSGEDLPDKEDLYPWQKHLLKTIEAKPDDRTIHWYWESYGKVGKSVFTKYMFYHHGALVCQKGKYGDIMNHAWNHKNLKLFIIDVPRTNGNSVSYTAIECIKTGIIINNKYETGGKAINSPHIVVFANRPPDTSQLSLDRWNIVEIINYPNIILNDYEKKDELDFF